MNQEIELILKWGIVSTGSISQDFCTAVKSLQTSKHQLTAVAARNLNDAQKFAQKYQIPSYYDNYDKLFEDTNVDIVYIGSINSAHRDLCLKAIEAGKHVLCEKPMAVSKSQQEEIQTAARNKNVFFMEGIWTRFFPIIHKIKEDIDKKTIGNLKYFVGNYLLNIKDVDRIRNKELGGGGILDIGIYPIQLACFMFDHERPIKISASGHLMETGVDESCSITLLFSDQRIAQINISTTCCRFDSAYLVGDKGIIEIPQHSWSPTEFIRPDGERVSIALPECEKTNFLNTVALRFEAEEIRLAIGKGLIEHPIMTHENSKLIMDIIEEAKHQIGYF